MINDPQEERYFGIMKDGGPVYTETNIDAFIVEPWNAISSILLIIPAIYFFLKLRSEWKKYGFVMYCVPLLILGGLGSTFFHAFRSSPFFLYLDVLPTAILTLSVGIYFWVKALPKWWGVFIVIFINILIRWYVEGNVSPHTNFNIAYALTGTSIFLPILYLSYKNKFKNLIVILISVLSLILSLMFREFDARYTFDYLPMGTHFLWHALSAIGAYYLAKYLILFRDKELNQINQS